jgi:putative flippase GtrA
VVGGLGIFDDLGVFSILYWGYFINFGQSTGTLYGQTISFSAAVTFNFVLNKVWTFQDKEKRRRKVTQQYLTFFAVSVSAWVIRTIIIYFLINYQSVWKFYSMPIATWLISLLSIERFALLIAIIIVMLWNFFGSKYLVFRREKAIVKRAEI